jgi:phenylalanine-4-hydroxylase
MLSPTEQYRERNIVITTGHQPNLDLVAIPHYTDEQHETWALMFARQKKALPGMASREYLEALKALQLPETQIPSLKNVSAAIESKTGWRVTRVAGLVPEKEFFDCLAQKLFPCTDFIRSRDELEYTPSPDMFHDIFGHCPLITNPYFAHFYEYFGRAALNANPQQLIHLQRIYWFTVEFGLIQNPEGIRIYGSGILSSVGEVPYSLSDQVRRHSFDFRKVESQFYEIYHMQDDLFVVPSFEWLLENFKKYVRDENLVV